jgi:DNA-directed RNA polymerase I, II, and III subunit RPABC1
LQDEVFVNVINIKRLQFNILKHTLVPNHRVLNTKETTDFKQKYNITDDLQIPDISRFSPVSQVIGIRPGEICEITRHSKTAINTLFYRRCQ